LQPARAAFVTAFAGALAGAAPSSPAALFGGRIRAALGAAGSVPAVDLRHAITAEVEPVLAAVAGPGAATIHIAAGFRHRATRCLIGWASEEVTRGETFLIAADRPIRATAIDQAGWASTLGSAFDRTANATVAVEVSGRAAVALAVALAIAAGAAVAADAPRRAAVAIAIAEPAWTTRTAIADFVTAQALAIAADASVFVVVIGG